MDIRHNESVWPPNWPEDSVARVPYWVYQDPANYTRELGRLFEGNTWNYVCLEADIPNKGDYRTNFVGALPVIVVRDADGSINCFENRCAHRGALIALDDAGTVENNFKCIYHVWSYDLLATCAASPSSAASTAWAACPRTSSASSSARASCAPRPSA